MDTIHSYKLNQSRPIIHSAARLLSRQPIHSSTSSQSRSTVQSSISLLSLRTIQSRTPIHSRLTILSSLALVTQIQSADINQSVVKISFIHAKPISSSSFIPTVKYDPLWQFIHDLKNDQAQQFFFSPNNPIGSSNFSYGTISLIPPLQPNLAYQFSLTPKYTQAHKISQRFHNNRAMQFRSLFVSHSGLEAHFHR